MFTDTDILFYEIKTENVYEDLYAKKKKENDKEEFDTGDYPKNSEYFSTKYKKVIDKMKNEAAGMLIEEFAGLRSQMYALMINVLKCKGMVKIQ